MQNFNIKISIEDLVCSKCCIDRNSLSEYVRSSNDRIILKNDYILNIIGVNTSYFTILLQNGINVYIRNIYFNEDVEICLSSNCNCSHLVTISGALVE